MKKIIIIIILLFSLNSFSQYSQGLENIGFASDKQMHFAGGGFASTWGYGLSYYKNENKYPIKIVRRKAKKWGILVGSAAGIAKELIDIGGTGFDLADLGYTITGAVAMTYTIDFLVGRRIHREKVLAKRKFDKLNK